MIILNGVVFVYECIVEVFVVSGVFEEVLFYYECVFEDKELVDIFFGMGLMVY